MDHHEEHSEEETDDQGSGERPEHPGEGTSPPANEEIDPERVERVKDQLREAGAN
jgi:hypothetical protein